MSFGREGFFASNKKPKKSNALQKTLDSIDEDIRLSPQVFFSAVEKFSNLINRISRNSCTLEREKNNPIYLDEGLVERIEKLLKAMRVTAEVIDNKQQELNCYDDAGYVGDARAEVCLLVARYIMRRGFPQTALGLFQSIEKCYPGFTPVYDYHIRLLKYLKMFDNAKQLQEKRDTLVGRSVPSLEARAPGYERPAYSFGCSI